MNKEDDELSKRREREEQRQGTEAETAPDASPRAQALAERVAAYRMSLHTDSRLVYPQLLDMSRPLGAMDSYTPMRVHLDSRPGYELDWELQQMMSHPHAMLRGSQRRSERLAHIALAPEQALSMYRRCVFVGDPGAGKTTLLKYLTLQSIDHQLKGLPDLPIYIELPAFARSGHRDLLEFASADWEERYGFPQEEALDYMREKLQDGDALLLLDGLDETGVETTKEPSEKASHQISRAITDAATRYQHALIVVTARKEGSHQHTHLAGFAELEVLGFRSEEIKQCVERWFVSHPDPSRRGNASELIAKLERTPRMQALAANPLLLSMILIVYEDRLVLPERRADLYEQCVDILLTKWNASRTLRPMPAFQPEHQRHLLEEVAWHFHQQGQRCFPERELLEVIAAFLPAIGLPPEQKGSVLEEMVAGNGLLKEQGRGWFGFLHLSFQEYFVAQYAARHQELDILIRQRDNPWWQEVFLLYAGYSLNVSLLLQQLLGLAQTNPLQDDMFYTNLILAGHCLVAADPTAQLIPLREEVVTRLFQVLKTTRYSLIQAQVAETLAEIADTAVNAQLVQLLFDEQLDLSVRQCIAETLGQIGKRAVVPQLVQVLSDESLDPRMRQSITTALVCLGERVSLWRLISLLSNEQLDWQLRQHMAEAFGRSEERTFAPQLAQLLSDEQLEWSVRESIAETLGQLGERSIAPQLVQLLSDEQITWPVRQGIAYGLAQLGERSIAPQLVQLLSDERLNKWVRQHIAETLGQLGERSIAPQLVQLLPNRQINSNVRGSTAVGLGYLGERSIVPQLVQLLSDRQLDSTVRECIAGALGQLGESSFAPQLLPLLSDEQLDQHLRRHIAGALGQLGEPSFALQLLPLLYNKQLDPRVRESIAHALGQLAVSPLVPLLLQVLFDEHLDWSVRLNIVEALGRRGERSVVPQLLRLLSDQQIGWPVRRCIVQALGQLGERSVVPQLLRVLVGLHLDGSICQRIADALGQPGERSLVPQLLQLLSDQQVGWPIREHIAYALGQLGERSVAPQLLPLLSDEQLHSQVRESIAYALGQLGEPSIASQLIQKLSDERLDPSLHRRIAGALERLGESSIVPQLLPLLSDQRLDSSVRQRIAEAFRTFATDDETLYVLTALLPTSDITDSIHHLLWTMCRQSGARIFMDDWPNDNSDQITYRIEHIDP